LDWRGESVRDPDTFLRAFWAQERALVAAGLPGIPGSWWRDTIERFYRSGKRRLVVRKGRRVFASTAVAPRLAVAEMLFGEHPHVPGTPPLIYAFVSVKREEAAARLSGVKAILDALGVACSPVGQTIQLTNRPALFSVLTASHRMSVGGTVAFCWCDEVSRWNDDKLGRNPAEEVVASIAPALATLPDARLFLNSSPLSTADYHAREYDRGETELQSVAFGSTWDINPLISEDETRLLEPDPRKWLREYAGQPQDGLEEDWFGNAVDLAVSDEPPMGVRAGMRPIFTIDPAFANDYFGYSVVTSEPASNDNARRLTIVHQSGALKPDGEPRKMLEWFRDHVVRQTMQDANRSNETPSVHTDQAEFYSLREVARQLGLNLILVPWTGGSGETAKATRFRAVRTAMLGGEVRISRRAELLRQFRSVSGVLLPSGNERIEFKRTGEGHCDELSAVVQGISLALETPPTAALPVNQPRLKEDPADWMKQAEREVNERRAREWKRSPMHVMRRAMGSR
jgi:hypothetical protein